jgi:tetratricopeptide (TPR) repeat protein
MSVASRPFERSADQRTPLAGQATVSRWLDGPTVPLGVVFLLAGPTVLVWPGFLFVFLGRLARARGAQGWLAQRSMLDVGWLALLAGSLIGFVVSPNGSASLARLAAVIAALSLFFWLQGQARTPDRLRLASWSLVAVCGLGAVAVLALIRGQLPASVLTRLLGPFLGMFAISPGISGDVLEVNSRFPVHQYGLAYLLLVVTPFLAAEAALGIHHKRRAMTVVGTLLAATLLAATEARGALLALAVAVALVASLRSRWFWGLLPLAALGLYLLLARGIISRSIEAAWLDTRLSIWTRSLNLLSDYPFSGAGLGMQTFAQVFAWNYGLPDPYQVVHSHNIFIQAYAEHGLVGLVGLIIILGGALLYAWRAVRSTPSKSRVSAAGVLGALVGSVLYGLTDQVPTTNYGLAILAALCALAVAGAGERESGRHGDGATGRRGDRATDGSGRAGERASGGAGSRRLAVSPSVLAVGGAALLLASVAPRWASGLALNSGAVQLAGVALNPGLELERKSAMLGRAETHLEAAIAWNPENVAANRVLARTRLLGHDVPAALTALEQATATRSLNDYERTQIGRLYLETGHWQSAFDLWQAAGQSALLREAADGLAGKRDYKAAAAAHAALVELHPDEPENYSNLAKALLAGPVPSVDEAMLWFERAAELNPESRRSLARQLVLEAEDCRTNERRGGGRLDVCVFSFGVASRVDPTYDRPEVELGSVYYYAGRHGQAAEHFRAALARDPDNGSTWHQLGQAEQAAGRLPEAVAAFEQAVRVAPSRAGLHASLGRMYLQIGQCQAAHSELTEALRLEPSNSLAQAQLARMSECR